ncbi:MAG: DHH family phosphoesterase [Ruminococcus sp.]|nr:DHH family phosphoesterase [Ruminococcus sp.]
MKDLKKLVGILSEGNVYIQTHNYPDPDAIASAFGLQKLLEHFGISAKICYDGTAEKLSAQVMLNNFGIEMISVRELENMSETDKIVTVDSQKYNSNLTDLIGDEVACIDHHPTVIPCEYLYKDVRIVGACSSIIAEYFFDNGIIPDRNTASALVYGIKLDTADFSRGVTQFDVEMYAKLFPYADNELLDRMKINTMEFADLKAYGSAIENIRVFGNVGFAFIPFECPDALIAMISDFILALDIIEFSVIYAVRGDGFKFSVRSEIPEMHAGKIINRALTGIGSGGGHARMAGGFAVGSSLPSDETLRNHEIRRLFRNAIAEETQPACTV